MAEPPRISVSQMLVYELRVRDAMTRRVIAAAPADSLRKLQRLMKMHRISGVPVVQESQLLGVVSIEDIITALDLGHIDDPAERWMSRQVVTLRDHYSLVRAVAEFDKYGFGRFPVVDAAGKLVGLITRGDVTTCLMHHLEKRAEEAVASEAVLTAQRAADQAAHREVLEMAVRAGDFDNAGKISQKMRQLLRARGIDPDVRRRAAIVAYEAETNIIIHSLGGQITVTIDPDRVVVEAADIGPGIEKVDLAMQEGWSTAGPLARELGFGAGMGLPNIKRCSDQFTIHSELGAGTTLRSVIALKKAEAPS